jgi:hypothetical protein
MVGVQANEIITIVNVLCRTCLAAAQGCFKRSIRRQSRRNHVALGPNTTASWIQSATCCALVSQQLALLFVRQWLCGVILQIGRKMLRGAHPQNSDGDALDAERELERRFER